MIVRREVQLAKKQTIKVNNSIDEDIDNNDNNNNSNNTNNDNNDNMHANILDESVINDININMNEISINNDKNKKNKNTDDFIEERIIYEKDLENVWLERNNTYIVDYIPDNNININTISNMYEAH